jgi:transcriptional regulator with XRE-family HTH domain
MGHAFGAFIKQMRQHRNLGLRQFCLEHGLDPGNHSKLERGLIPPPARDKLERLAAALGLDASSREWVDFFDLAFADRGEVPDDILADHELAAKLPLVFRTIRGEKVPDAQLDQLAERIRRA